MSWPMVKLGDVINVHYGKALKADQRVSNGSIHVFGSSGIIGNHDKTLCSYPTIIIGRKGSVGAITWAPDGGWIIDTAYYVEIKDNSKLDLRYLFYILSGVDLTKKTITTSIPGLNRDDLYDTFIKLPPFEEQKRIVDLLNKAEGIRQKREQSIKLADDFLHSTFLKMFGDPVVNEKKWSVKKLKDVCDNVIDCPHSTPKWVDNGTVCIRTSNLSKGGWVWSDKRFVSDETYLERTKRGAIEEGDIILSREGTVGVAAIVPENLKLCMGQRLVQLKLDKNQVTPEYLLAFLLYELDPVRISRVMSGSTSKHINVSELRQLDVMLPPMEQQILFSGIRKKIINISNKSNIDSSLFETLSFQLAS